MNSKPRVSKQGPPELRERPMALIKGRRPFQVPLRDLPSSVFSPLMDPEIRAVKPPPKGKEFDRVPSPAPSTHSSNCGSDLDVEELTTIRNLSIEEYFLEERNKVPVVTDAQRVYERLKPIWDRSLEATETVDEETRQMSDTSLPDEGDEKKWETQLVNSIMDAEQKRIDKEIESALATSTYPQFSFQIFQNCRLASWKILCLSRKERLLRGELFSELPKEWVDSDMEPIFDKAFGPMDKNDSGYELLLVQFTRGRLEMAIEMMEDEKKLLEWMIESQALQTGLASTMADELATARKELEATLEPLFESNIDLNPYTSPFHMDMFVVPRPKHKMEDFTSFPTSFEKLTEFMPDEKNTCFVPAPNPAVFDVDLEGTEIILDDGTDGSEICALAEKNEGKPTKLSTTWLRYLGYLKIDISKYMEGVSPKVFVERFRTAHPKGMQKVEDNFGKVCEANLVQLKDIFLALTLGDGEAQRTILFPSVLEGVIISPQDILDRQWKRIRFILECDGSIRLEDVSAAYQRFYGAELSSFLNWGFRDMRDFIDYSRKVLPGALPDITIVTDESQKEALELEEALKYEDGFTFEDSTETEMEEWLSNVLHNNEENWLVDAPLFSNNQL